MQHVDFRHAGGTNITYSDSTHSIFKHDGLGADGAEGC